MLSSCTCTNRVSPWACSNLTLRRFNTWAVIKLPRNSCNYASYVSQASALQRNLQVMMSGWEYAAAVFPQQQQQQQYSQYRQGQRANQMQLSDSQSLSVQDMRTPSAACAYLLPGGVGHEHTSLVVKLQLRYPSLHFAPSHLSLQFAPCLAIHLLLVLSGIQACLQELAACHHIYISPVRAR